MEVKNPNEPASAKQIAFATTLGITIPAAATKGEASAQISAALAKEKAEKAGKPISESAALAGDSVAISIATLERAIAGLSGLLAELKGER